MGSTRGHWDDVYEGKPAIAVSWYQPHSALSLKLIEATSPGHASAVIDVGGGASTLVDDLLAKGYADLTVLDVAEAALAQSKVAPGRQSRRGVMDRGRRHEMETVAILCGLA
jgi:hypothetical protein